MRSTWINELKESASSMGDPSVPHSGWFLSQGGSHDGAQIGSASRQTMAPSVTWGESLSLSPSGRIFPGKRKWAGWSSSWRAGNTTSVYLSFCMCGCWYTQLLRWPLCHVLTGRGPSLNSKLFSAFFHRLSRLSCDIRTFFPDLLVFLPNDTDLKQEFLHVTYGISFQQNMMEHLLDITRKPLICVAAPAQPRCVGVRCR